MSVEGDIAARLTAKRDKLLAERAAIIQRIGAIDREVGDCYAAARLFQLGWADQPIPTPKPPSESTVRSVAERMLTDRGPLGLRAADLRKEAERCLARQIHYKSASVALYRLMKAGRARRDGHVWFAALASPK